jgi:ferredoxin
MSKYLVTVDQKTCIGCGACEAIAPKHFVMEEVGDDLKAKAVVGEVGGDVTDCKEAEETCPVECISVKKLEKELMQ